jgi:N-formylglutamate deformylase
VFPVSRLVVDPERFSEDSQEPMSQVGMGATYTKVSLRQPLREQPTQGKRQELLERFSHPHHQKLTEVVEGALLANKRCLIIDGHSFPALPLPYELNQTAFRPDFCLDTDDFHTPEELVARVETIFESCGYSTARDQPFSGTIVPMKHYRKDRRVQSLMIEINLWLYLGEDYSVETERVEVLIEILRRVTEGLEDN